MDRGTDGPPFVEALCEIAFDGSEWDATIPGLFFQRLRNRFPVKSDASAADSELPSLVRDSATADASRESRSRFSRQDGTAVVQLERDLVAVNVLRPDPQLTELNATVREAARHYRDLAKPKGVARTRFRTIHAFAVTGSNVRAEDYFLAYPRVSEDPTASTGPFILRLGMPAAHPGHEVVATFGFTPAAVEGCAGFVLDILDTAILRGRDESFGRVDSALRQAFEHVGRAFESAIADKARQRLAPAPSPVDASDGAARDRAVAAILRLLALASPESGDTSLSLARARRRIPNLMDLKGLGKEIWRGEDAQDYVNRLRDEWT